MIHRNEADKADTQPSRSGSESSLGMREKTKKRLLEGCSAESFDEWYREHEFTQNIRNGTPYFNGPSEIKSPERHSPSSLLQCHRKIAYRQLNAPAESPDPAGIFWIGSQFEEEIALPYLRNQVAGSDEYVTNSLWVDFTVQTDAGEIRIKGETDPVIVDGDADPLLLTEIKTKQSVDGIDSPSQHHKAQTHAYMKGLSEKSTRNLTDAIILYGGRTDLSVQAFHVEFDPAFWTRTVVEWAKAHTSYRLRNELPPAEPEYNWECQFCSYRERCGQGEKDSVDVPPAGLLPQYSEYPREKLVEYIQAQEDAKLTPTLAKVYPDLAKQHGAFDWHCPGCAQDFEWDVIEWHSNSERPPKCPVCDRDNLINRLRGPAPERQYGGGKTELQLNDESDKTKPN